MVLSLVHLASIVLTRSLDTADVFFIEQVEARADVDLGWLKATVETEA